MENKNFHQVIVKAWQDAEFKKQLIQNPEITLSRFGIEVPKGVKVTILEQTDTHYYLVIPQKTGNLSDEQLEMIAGGALLDNMIGAAASQLKSDLGDTSWALNSMGGGGSWYQKRE